MNCPVTTSRLTSILTALLLWIGGCIALTLINLALGNPVTLKALLFVYIAFWVSNQIPKMHAKLLNWIAWNRWESQQMKNRA